MLYRCYMYTDVIQMLYRCYMYTDVIQMLYRCYMYTDVIQMLHVYRCYTENRGALCHQRLHGLLCRQQCCNGPNDYNILIRCEECFRILSPDTK